MIQTSLSFATITAHEASEARQKEFARPLSPALPRPPKRPPGRPSKKRPLPIIDDISTTESDKKQHRTNWMSSPYLNEIVATYKRLQCARATVRHLRANAPDDRFQRLSHSTILAWFGKTDRDKFTMLPHFDVQYRLNSAAIRGTGRPSAFASSSTGVEQEIINTLQKMRQAGTPVDIRTAQFVMYAIIDLREPELLERLKLSKAFVSRWLKSTLSWSWRRGTTAASKLPLDWEDQGVKMAMRLAAIMAHHKIHPSLVINMDQTGVQLVPSAAWTFEECGASTVGIIGQDDKRQITACIASSLDGNLLPLQLIFQGKTARSLPDATPLSISTKAHLTFSDNHWSNQKTMQEWIVNILMPYAESQIAQHHLHSDSNIALVLDVWAVHKSEAFRLFLRTYHPRIRLVYVPANCTSKLQVADVALQRPFKHSVKTLFNEWAVELVKEQISNEGVVNLTDKLKMQTVKPKILEWCIESWRGLRERKELILDGWKNCCTNFFDVKDPERRLEALSAVADQKLEEYLVPTEEEQDAIAESDPEESDIDDERDFSIPIPEGKKSGRITRQPDRLSLSMRNATGILLNSAHVAMEISGEEADSDANGMDQ